MLHRYSRSNLLKENACSHFCTPSSKLASATQLHKQFFWPGLKTPSHYPIVIFVEHSHLAWAVLLLQKLGPRPLTNFAFVLDLLPPGLENKKAMDNASKADFSWWNNKDCMNWQLFFIKLIKSDIVLIFYWKTHLQGL